MDILSIPVPAVYREESADFRFFQKWFALALSKVQYDTEEFFDLFDPLRCPQNLLWMLGDTMGYKYDDRMSPAFNRLALVYFMSMIRLKGSKDGVTLSAQVNLDQFHLQDEASKKDILNNRLEDTSIPSNAVYVQPHVEEGYIDLVYFSDRVPTDVCTEYTRPVGMYLVPHAGVRYDAKAYLSVDARLTNTKDLKISIGPTHVGHYNHDDYSRMQRLQRRDISGDHVIDTQDQARDSRTPAPKLTDTRDPVWYRNSEYEVDPNESINPGYRALYSLQLSNPESTTRSLLNGISNLHSVSESDVSVFDGNNEYTQEYFESRRNARNSIPAVESRPMGTMGDSLSTVQPET